jgi:hypothetical protein
VAKPRGGRFHYRLVDLSGSEVGRIEREGPLRADDVVAAGSAEAWRIVAVLGVSATVVPARR